MSQPEPAEPVDLFLCHSSVDKPWVERLAAAVEDQKWGDRPLRVFLDKWDIPGGTNIVRIRPANRVLDAAAGVARGSAL